MLFILIIKNYNENLLSSSENIKLKTLNNLTYQII
jgi:hypothetical protein